MKRRERERALRLAREIERRGLTRRMPGWTPLAGPQREAFESDAFELLYGGAAGGGKSDLLLGLARIRHRNVLLVRREFPDLERSLIWRALQFFGERRQYNASKHVWNIGDQRIEFGHVERESDAEQYQSAQYDLIGFDEATQFTLGQYEFLISRARTTISGQRVRVVACTNPVGEGVGWVMGRWAAWLSEMHPRPALPGELRWYARLDGQEVEVESGAPFEHGGEMIYPRSRTFVPARLADNPYLGEDYRATLQLLPEPLRSQLLNGDWKVGATDDPYQVIPVSWVRAAQARWTERRPATDDGRLLPLSCVGVDAARGGDDKTVIARRYGNWVAPLDKRAGVTTPDGQSVAALFVPIVAREGGYANVDVIGIGSSAYDIASESGVSVKPVNFAARSGRRDRAGVLEFVNTRAEAYWAVREALDPENGDNIALPPDPELLSDLCAARYTVQTNGIMLRSKDEIRKRLGRSPDCGDAVALAFYGSGPIPAGLLGKANPRTPSRFTGGRELEGGRWRRE